MKSFLTYFYVLATIAAVSTAAKSNPYCSKSCRDYKGKLIKHIGCNPSNTFDKDHCPSNAKMVEMTLALKTMLVNIHNEKRNFTAGGNDGIHSPACKMATMRWSNELESLAKLNVHQCKMQHDHCHSTTKFNYSGQNLYISYKQPTGEFNDYEMFNSGVNYWYKEREFSNQDFINAYPKRYSGPAIGHFTAMMREDNTHLGCGAATYNRGNTSYYLIACNYATTNIIKKPIYTSCQSAASSCLCGRNSQYINLCSENERYGSQ